jgi:hypothetical protein
MNAWVPKRRNGGMMKLKSNHSSYHRQNVKMARSIEGSRPTTTSSLPRKLMETIKIPTPNCLLESYNQSQLMSSSSFESGIDCLKTIKLKIKHKTPKE